MRNYTIIAFCYFLFFHLSINAQEIQIKEGNFTKDSIPKFILFDTELSAYMEGEEDIIWNKFLKITPDDKFEIIKSYFDKQGMKHTIYRQYYC
jgi:hypothetical protein